MNIPSFSFVRRWLTVALVVTATFCVLSPLVADASPAPFLLDDFSNAEHTLSGAHRLLITDKDLGSQSHATQQCENGVLHVTGELAPGRGVPAFITVPLLLSADVRPHDLSDYEGVRVRVKVTKGIISLQVASSEVQNFDYHTSAPLAGKRGEFQEIRVAFKDLKRGWSEQTPLNAKLITGVNLVAFGMAKDAFAYEVDEIGFY